METSVMRCLTVSDWHQFFVSPEKQMKYRDPDCRSCPGHAPVSPDQPLLIAAGFHGSTASQYLLDNAGIAGSQSYNQVLQRGSRCFPTAALHRQLKTWLALGWVCRPCKPIPAVKAATTSIRRLLPTKPPNGIPPGQPYGSGFCPGAGTYPVLRRFLRYPFPVYARLRTEEIYQYSSFGPVGSGNNRTNQLQHSSGTRLLPASYTKPQRNNLVCRNEHLHLEVSALLKIQLLPVISATVYVQSVKICTGNGL